MPTPPCGRIVPDMKVYWKTLISLLVALPMLSYVAGTLAAAQQDPPEYAAIVLRPAQAEASSVAVLDASDTEELPVLTPAPVRAVTPTPDDLDDDSDNAGRDGRKDDDDGDDGDRDDDSSGSGSGGDDDSSGPRKDDDDDKSGSGKDDDDDSSGPGSGGDDEPDETDDPDEPDEPDDH